MPLPHHGVAELIGDTNPRSPSAQNDDTLVTERRSADPDRGDRRSQGDRPGTLHVVVESAGMCTVLFEYAPSIARREVLPMQQRVREQPGHRIHVLCKKSSVALATDSGMATADVGGIVK